MKKIVISIFDDYKVNVEGDLSVFTDKYIIFELQENGLILYAEESPCANFTDLFCSKSFDEWSLSVFISGYLYKTGKKSLSFIQNENFFEEENPASENLPDSFIDLFMSEKSLCRQSCDEYIKLEELINYNCLGLEEECTPEMFEKIIACFDAYERIIEIRSGEFFHRGFLKGGKLTAELLDPDNNRFMYSNYLGTRLW